MIDYSVIKEYYQKAFEQYGPTPKGLAWQNRESMERRFDIMAGLLTPGITSDVRMSNNPSVVVLDLGCGTGGFADFLKRWSGDASISYTGLDTNPAAIEHCKNRWPDKKDSFKVQDILKEPLPAESYDFVVMNGILTVKDKLSFNEMWEFTKKLINASYRVAKKGIAFNVMSKQVDWERDDLFHLSLDTLASYLTKEVSRHFVVRNDYGLYEYTTYVYKNR